MARIRRREVLRSRGVAKPTAAEALAAAPELPGQGKRTDLGPRDDVTKLKRGNQVSYLAARLNRDHPEIAARVRDRPPGAIPGGFDRAILVTYGFDMASIPTRPTRRKPRWTAPVHAARSTAPAKAAIRTGGPSGSPATWVS